MRSKRLLDRLMTTTDERRGAPILVGDEIAQSISEHLLRLLNSRRGSVSIDASYGVPDFSKLPGGLANPDTKVLEAELLNTISRYEKRLLDTKIVFRGIEMVRLALRFGVSGRARVGAESYSIEMNAALLADGRIEIEAVNG